MDLIVTADGVARWHDLVMRCALGRAGISTDKREGDGATPAGRFALRRVLYRPDRLAPPQTALPVSPIAPDDGWCDAPDDPQYNRPVKLPYAGRHERMWRGDGLYDLVVVLGHNDDPVRPGAGSAVFLHVAPPDGGPTAGCVGLSRPDLLRVIGEARPGDGILVQPQGAASVDERPSIRLLHHLARTGGTLISRCLGCMQSVVLLSEINPQGVQIFDPLVQAHRWFNLLTPQDVAALQNNAGIPFAEGIALIERRSRERGQTLLVRDWTHLDFTGVPFVEQPRYELTLARVLAPHFRIVQVATVRHPLETWLSLQRGHLPGGRTIPLELFLHGCRRFAEQAQAIGFIRYEDILRQPGEGIRALCDRLALPFDPTFLDKWYRYENVTGDPDRSSRTTIDPPKPTRAPAELLARMAASADYRRTLALLGYTHPD